MTTLTSFYSDWFCLFFFLLCFCCCCCCCWLVTIERWSRQVWPTWRSFPSRWRMRTSAWLLRSSWWVSATEICPSLLWTCLWPGHSSCPTPTKMRTEKGEYLKTVRKQQTSSFTLQIPPVSDVISNLEQWASFYRTQDVLHQLRNPLIAQIPVYTQSNEKCYLNKYGDEVIGRAAVTDSVSQFNSFEWQRTDGVAGTVVEMCQLFVVKNTHYFKILSVKIHVYLLCFFFVFIAPLVFHPLIGS